MLKVKNFLGNDFDDLCFDLANEIIVDGYEPDIVIGIKNGGSIIAKKVLKYLDIVHKTKYYELIVQHNCTKRFEKNHIDRFLRIIPYPILDLIRVCQVCFYEFLYDYFSHFRKYYVEKNLDEDLRFYLQEGGKKILIIDDTIDSGKTMNSAKQYLDWFGIPMPGCLDNEIRFAVVTTTYKNPIVKPNYLLFNRTIIRFPWAFDNKGEC